MGLSWFEGRVTSRSGVYFFLFRCGRRCSFLLVSSRAEGEPLWAAARCPYDGTGLRLVGEER